MRVSLPMFQEQLHKTIKQKIIDQPATLSCPLGNRSFLFLTPTEARGGHTIRSSKCLFLPPEHTLQRSDSQSVSDVFSLLKNASMKVERIYKIVVIKNLKAPEFLSVVYVV